MRGSPSCEVVLRPSALWRAALALACLAALATLLGWARLAAQPGTLELAGAAIGFVCIAAALSLLRPVRGSLRWDGSGWTLAPQGAEPRPGALAVALDLGWFLLLRFSPAGPRGWRGGHWIALERRGLELEWHAFRCAVYSPRPADGAHAADAWSP